MVKSKTNKTPIIVTIIAGIFLLLAILLNQALKENYENRQRKASATASCLQSAKLLVNLNMATNEADGFNKCMREKGWDY